jgi:cysteine desulfurase
MKIVYLDNNATTAISPEVREAISPYLNEYYGNPSSLYELGRTSRKAIEHAREQVARLLNCDPEEIIFTSCGSESDNGALWGTLWANPSKKHIITSVVEHHAILYTCQALEKQGYEVTYVPVDEGGILDLDYLKKSIRPDTALVSIMWANNETGVISPIPEIARICKEKNVYFHTDAVQAIGKLPIDLKHSTIDMLSISGHKLHAPKGVGVFYLRKGVRWLPYLQGGHQESGFRAGTENTIGIVAMGKAAEIAQKHLSEENKYLASLRDKFEKEVVNLISDVRVTAAHSPRLANTSHLCFKDAKDDAILLLLNEVGVCASSGSACNAGSKDVSHVLRAMKIPKEYIRGSVRISLSRYNTQEDINYLLEQLPVIVERTRKAKQKRKQHQHLHVDDFLEAHS